MYTNNRFTAPRVCQEWPVSEILVMESFGHRYIPRYLQDTTNVCGMTEAFPMHKFESFDLSNDFDPIPCGILALISIAARFKKRICICVRPNHHKCRNLQNVRWEKHLFLLDIQAASGLIFFCTSRIL